MGNRCVEDLSRMSKRVAYLSWASCGLAVVVSCFTFLELLALSQLDRADVYSWEIDYIDPTLTLVAGASAILYFVVFVAAAIVSLRWIYRANTNAHCLNSDMSMSPGWNVGWFFVPIATWWKPYQGVKDVWRTSANPQDPDSVAGPDLLVKWWTCWVLSNIAGTASFRLQLRATEVGTQILANVADIVSTLAFIPATYFFIAVVRNISELQRRYATDGDATSTVPEMGSA